MLPLISTVYLTQIYAKILVQLNIKSFDLKHLPFAKGYKMMKNDAKGCKMMKNDAKGSKMMKNDAKECKMVKKDAK